MLNNFELESIFIKFQENLSMEASLTLNLFLEGVKHISHKEGVKDELCLLEIYRLYIGLVEVFVICACPLFNAGVDKKPLREQAGRRSNALLKFEKLSGENKAI